jgi:glycosyltransferase involved in cell wall biosynthesis
MDYHASMKPTEFIFISESAIIGGIETLMVRMANRAHNEGHYVSVFCPRGPIVSELAHGIKWTEVSDSAIMRKKLMFYTPEESTKHVSVWVSHPFMIPDAYRLQRKIWRKWMVKSNSMSGIFIPAQFLRKDLIGRAKNTIILKTPPLGSIYFMSDAVRASFVDIFGDSYKMWPVKRLAYNADAMNSNWAPEQTDRLNIISIGRLTPFKAYNFGASEIVKEIRDAGVDCEWHIWGDGEDLEPARAYARAAGVDDFLRFHGNLPYSLLTSEVCRHNIFVGMGTAALEAAACGVPTVIALVNSKHDCAGFLFETPSDSIGEDISRENKKKIFDVLLEFSALSLERKKEVGSKCQAAVENRMKADDGGIDVELQGGLQYPVDALSTLRMNIYTFSVEIWRCVAKGSRRYRNFKR